MLYEASVARGNGKIIFQVLYNIGKVKSDTGHTSIAEAAYRRAIVFVFV